MFKFRLLSLIFLLLCLQSCAVDDKKNISLNETHKFDQAETTFSKPIYDYSNQEIENTISESIKENTKPKLENVNIGLMVPMSGKNEKIGQDLFAAAKMALIDSGVRNLTILPLDTAGKNYSARRALEFFKNNNTQLIIGPFFSNKLKPIKKLLPKYHIKLIAFSNDEFYADENYYLFGFSPKQQMEHIIKYALTQNIKDFRAILPSNSFGRLIGKQIKIILEEHNLNAIIDYHGNSKESIDLVTQKVIAQTHKEFAKKTAMIIPESGKNLDLIMKNFNDFDLEPNRFIFLGSGNWEDRSIFKLKELFDDENRLLAFAGGNFKQRELFEEKFQEIYDHLPLRISTMAYDLISLVSFIVSENEEFSTDALELQTGFAGIDGVFRLEPNGIATRLLQITKISPNEFSTIQESLKSFPLENSIKNENKQKPTKPEHYFY